MKTKTKTVEEGIDIAKLIARVESASTSKMAAVLRIQTELLKAIHDFMYEKGVTQLMPVVVSPNHRPVSARCI